MSKLSLQTFIFPLLLVLLQPRIEAATVAYWRFESGGLLADSGPNGYNLNTFSPAPDSTILPTTGNGSSFRGTIPQTGQNNLGAASLAGAGFYSTHPSGNNDWNYSTFTIETFFNLSDTTGIRSLAGQLGGTQRRWLSIVNGGNLGLILQGSSDGVNYSETTYTPTLSGMRNLSTNTDYYMAMVIDLSNADPSQRIRMYLKDLTNNGELLTQNISSSFTSLLSSNVNFSIGSTANPSSPFSGLIDEVRFSNSALAVSELLIAPEPTRALVLMLGLVCMIVRRSRSHLTEA